MAAFVRTKDLYKWVLPAPKTETHEDKLSQAAGWIFLACEDHITTISERTTRSYRYGTEQNADRILNMWANDRILKTLYRSGHYIRGQYCDIDHDWKFGTAT